MTTDTPRTRLSPDERRAQLLELGMRLFGSRPIEEISIDLVMEEAGVSRGLIYHYFDGKQGYREAVVRYAAEDLFAQTAPPAEGGPMERLAASTAAYVDYVVANEAGYRSLVAAAAGGNEAMRSIYDATFEAMGERFYDEGAADVLGDSPAVRLVIRGWQAMVEKLVLTWCSDRTAMPRADLLALVTNSLPALVHLT
ncbi:MAG: TetR/AcrR family transcriptional regulator [Nocardioidaceae bacterium]|nr:TetR/AcrR family transcriptional regulator [Nocardioidaceae bacterium]MCL2612092.1 TetR/AcrR family transcriptional regulator [Nocardioidaceae bacterium]